MNILQNYFLFLDPRPRNSNASPRFRKDKPTRNKEFLAKDDTKRTPQRCHPSPPQGQALGLEKACFSKKNNGFSCPEDPSRIIV